MVVLPRSSPIQVFVRLEESTVAHCPSLSPVSAPFLRNARHFLPFLSPFTLCPPVRYRCPPSPFFSRVIFALSPSPSLSFSFSLYVCAPSLFVLYLGRLARANTTFRRRPLLSYHGLSFMRETDGPKKIFETLARLEIFRHPRISGYLIRARNMIL